MCESRRQEIEDLLEGARVGVVELGVPTLRAGDGRKLLVLNVEHRGESTAGGAELGGLEGIVVALRTGPVVVGHGGRGERKRSEKRCCVGRSRTHATEYWFTKTENLMLSELKGTVRGEQKSLSNGKSASALKSLVDIGTVKAATYANGIHPRCIECRLCNRVQVVHKGLYMRRHGQNSVKRQGMGACKFLCVLRIKS